jgi:hypothetical protein
MEVLIPALIGLLGATSGWWIIHVLTARRDLANKRRDRRIEAMVEVFREITRVRSHSSVLTSSEFADSLSRISTGIELFGTKRQLELFQVFAPSVNSERLRGVHDLIDELRNDIRQSLALPANESTVNEFRFNVPIADQSEAI